MSELLKSAIIDLSKSEFNSPNFQLLKSMIIDLNWSGFQSQDFVKPTQGKVSGYTVPLRTCIFESQNFKHSKTQIVDLAGSTYETGTS